MKLRLALTARETVETGYVSKAVDADHRINTWIGQTLTRDAPVAIPEEATVYTNIRSAEPQKLKYGGTDDGVPTPDNLNVFVLASGQGSDGVLSTTVDDTARTFRGAYGEASGKFTCAADDTCSAVETGANPSGQRVLTSHLNNGWTFVSDGYVESVATQDESYMYFGYWLRKPLDPNEAAPNYDVSTFFGGGTAAAFTVPGDLSDADDALTATYKGGAAGMYVTRKLSFTNEGVDDKSPADYGRFTANAELKAYFGAHPSFAEVPDGDDADDLADTPNRQNRIKGTIKNFTDGAKDLGFEVTLGLTEFSTGTIASGPIGSATAKFSDTATNTAGTGTGTWDGQFYGPAADTDANESANTTLPSGVAGKFNVESAHTVVVGAFGARKQ